MEVDRPCSLPSMMPSNPEPQSLEAPPAPSEINDHRSLSPALGLSDLDDMSKPASLTRRPIPMTPEFVHEDIEMYVDGLLDDLVEDEEDLYNVLSSGISTDEILTACCGIVSGKCVELQVDDIIDEFWSLENFPS
eukprot:scaffold322341_cov32-Tisochrysis_lutea.AAC.1